METSIQQERVVKGNLIPKLNFNADYKYFTDLPYQFSLYNKKGSIPDEKYEKIFKIGKSSINDNAAELTFRALKKGVMLSISYMMKIKTAK